MAATVNERDSTLSAAATRVETVTLPPNVTVPSTNVDGLGALAGLDSVDLAQHVVGQLASSKVTGLGALALIDKVDLATQATGTVDATTQVTNLGSLAYASSLAADQIGAGTLAAGVVYAGTLSADNITSGTLTSGVTYTGSLSADQITTGSLAAERVGAGKLTVKYNNIAPSVVMGGDGSSTSSPIFLIRRYASSNANDPEEGDTFLPLMYLHCYRTDAGPEPLYVSTKNRLAANFVSESGYALRLGSDSNYSLYVDSGTAAYCAYFEGNVYIGGNISLGGTIPGSKVSGEVSSASYASSSGSTSYVSGSNVDGAVAISTAVINSSGARLECGTYKATMQSDGNFVVYHGSTAVWQSGTGTSDVRLKEGIVDTAKNGLATVNALRVVDYQWKSGTPFDDGGVVHTGFIAQEVAEVVPQSVALTADTYLIHKEELVQYLVKAVQELSAEVEALKKQINQ